MKSLMFHGCILFVFLLINGPMVLSQGLSTCESSLSTSADTSSFLTWHPILHDTTIDTGYKYHGRPLIRNLDKWMIQANQSLELKASILDAIFYTVGKMRVSLEQVDKNSLFYQYAQYKLDQIEKIPHLYRVFLDRLRVDDRLRNHIFDTEDPFNPTTKLIKSNLGDLLYDARGKWKEILAFQQFRDIQRYDVRLNDLVSKKAQKRALERKVTMRELSAMLEHEVDFVLGDGSWVEIKNYSYEMDENSHLYAKLIQKAKNLSTLINYESEIQRRQIPLYFVFFGSGANPKVVKELESWGITVIFRPSLVKGAYYLSEEEKLLRAETQELRTNKLAPNFADEINNSEAVLNYVEKP